MAIENDWTTGITDGVTLDDKTFQEDKVRNAITGWVFGEDHHANASGTKVTSAGCASAEVALLGASQTFVGAKTFAGAVVTSAQVYTPASGATATLDLSKGNDHVVTMPSAGNITLALTGVTAGQKFLVSLDYNTSATTAAWFSTIRWTGGSAPTQTMTSGKRDQFGFKAQTTGTFDGYICGQNI